MVVASEKPNDIARKTITNCNPKLLDSGGGEGLEAINSSSLSFVLLLTFNCSSWILSMLHAIGGGAGFLIRGRILRGWGGGGGGVNPQQQEEEKV